MPDLLDSHKKIRLVVVTHVDDAEINSGTVHDVDCIRSIGYGDLHHLHVMFSVAFCLLSVPLRYILPQSLVASVKNAVLSVRLTRINHMWTSPPRLMGLHPSRYGEIHEDGGWESYLP